MYFQRNTKKYWRMLVPFFSHGNAIDLQILFVVKHKKIMFRYEINQCRNVINQCLVSCAHCEK